MHGETMPRKVSDLIAQYCIRFRTGIVISVILPTLFFLLYALQVNIHTVFTDLLPANHPYIRTHEQFKVSFGGSNMVSIMLKVRKGDIFQIKSYLIVKLTSDDLPSSSVQRT